MFLFCVFIGIAGILTAAFTLSSQPSLGGQWQPVPDSDNGLLLINAPHFEQFAGHSTTTVRAISNDHGTVVPLRRATLLSDPDQYASFAQYNRFMEEMKKLAAILHGKEVILIIDTGQSVSLPVLPVRSIFSLPFNFWICSVIGLLCFLISAGVWSYRRGEITSRLLAITGFGFFAGMLCLAIYSSRELSLDVSLFRYLEAGNHFFMILFCYSLLLLFCYYPCQLGNHRWIISISVIAMLIWLNETLQWVEPPVHAYFLLNHIIPYFAAIILGIVQWRLTRRQPVNRAALRWFILSIWISIGGAGAMFIIPSLNGHYEVIPLWITSFGVLAMFIFFALGTLRYGLFGLEKWWFSAWAWLITGAVVILTDLLVVMLLDLNMNHLLPFSVLLLGWLYFPARYWIWNILERKERRSIEETLPHLLQTLFSSGNRQDSIRRWPEILKQMFHPLELTALPHPAPSIVARDHGLILEVPGIDNENGWRLVANRGGTKLFDHGEQKLAAMVLDLARTILDITTRTFEAQMKGAEKERERIMRDLHDDVLPKLITLKHRSDFPLSQTADSAFQALRDCIYLLRSREKKLVIDVLADWRAEVASRLEAIGIKLEWSQTESDSQTVMNALQQINGARIVQEAISNIIKHARAHHVQVNAVITDALTLTIEDDGQGITGLETREWRKIGAGNMLARARELGGKVEWRNIVTKASSHPSGFQVSLNFPFNDEQALNKK